jgi:hypothetical protein
MVAWRSDTGAQEIVQRAFAHPTLSSWRATRGVVIARSDSSEAIQNLSVGSGLLRSQ